jgi:transcription elongation factor GreB
VSKAFTSEERADDPIVVRARAPLPQGVTNYVTARGLDLLRAELEALDHERVALETTPDDVKRTAIPALAARAAELAARVGSAALVDVRGQEPDQVRFGATVEVRDGAGNVRRYQIVGVDEANAREGRLAFVSPLARALLGGRIGETATVQTPGGEEELELVDIRYDQAD